MWYLLLVFPISALLMGIVARVRPTTAIDRTCSDIDVRIDVQHALLMSAPAIVARIPAQGPAARPVVVTHLVAS